MVEPDDKLAARLRAAMARLTLPEQADFLTWVNAIIEQPDGEGDGLEGALLEMILDGELVVTGMTHHDGPRFCLSDQALDDVTEKLHSDPEFRRAASEYNVHLGAPPIAAPPKGEQ